MIDIVEQLGGPAPAAVARPRLHASSSAGRDATVLIVDASDDRARLVAYHRLRRAEFVERQGLCARDDHDGADAQAGTRVLVALSGDGHVIGGVRLHRRDGDRELGWWQGSRLVTAAGAE